MLLDRKGQTASRPGVGIVVLLAVVISAGTAFAQTPTKTQPVNPKADVKSKDKPSRKRPATPAKKGIRGRRKTAAMKPDPNAKWFCENTTVTVDPMWRGPKGVSFTFDIRNDGTAPLHIKAKGG